jgi:multiple sugar transport system ATP-binding protein
MRPEHFLRAEEAGEGATWTGRRVALVEMLGAEMLVHFETSVHPVLSEDMKEAVDDPDAYAELERAAREGGQRFVARFEPGSPPKLGDEMTLGFRTDRLHFFDPSTGQALR